MSNLLQYSMFQDVLFPPESEAGSTAESSEFSLQKLLRYQPPLDTVLAKSSLVVFDFETTGLDAREDEIIEIGAIRLENFEPVEEYSTLLSVDQELSSTITKLTGITSDMLNGQPVLKSVLPEFLKFIDKSILVAHNAEFDMGFLRAACKKLGYNILWPSFCTLKLARQLLPQLESKNLDSLARHYELSFEARHRSIGDAKVTAAVLKKLLDHDGVDLKTWNDIKPIAQVKD